MGTFNESGDDQGFPAGFVNSSAKPKLAKAIANSWFDETPDDFNPLLTGIKGYDSTYWRLLGTPNQNGIEFTGTPQPFDI